MSDFITERDLITGLDLQPTHREHYLVTRARHEFENRQLDYDNACSNFDQELGTAEDMILYQQLLLAAEDNLRAAREFVLAAENERYAQEFEAQRLSDLDIRMADELELTK